MSSNGSVEPKKATELTEIGNKLAVLVGINEHVDSSISRLNFSVKDIQDFHEILVDPEKGKYKKNNVIVLSDVHSEKPIRNNILSKLTTMSRSASPEDSILFYFSGHGYERNKKPYLLCFDSYRNTIKETALPTELIRKTMEASLARVKIIIIDACHSGAIKGIKDSGIMTKSFFESFFPPSEGFVVLTSCRLGECSHEWSEKEHSVFSYYLLEGLRGTADRDGDKIITITDAFRYSSENVRRWAFEKGLEQSPYLEAKISGDIPFVFVGRALKKEEPFNKSIINTISLVTTKYTDGGSALAQDMCGSLLQFVVPTEIQKTSTNKYKFPYGTLNPDSGYSGSIIISWVEASFAYEKEHWGKIDEILTYFSSKYHWKSIEYEITKKIDLEKLVQKCRESGFKIVSFNPEKGKQALTVDTKAWLETKTTFENRKDFSRVHILSKNGRFPDEFYSTLSPENIIEFIKNCLE